MAYRSISLRLTIWFSFVFFAGLALFGAVMWFHLKDTLTSGRSRTLERRTERLGDLLHDTETDASPQRAKKFQAFAEATGGGLVEIFDTRGARALASPTAVAQAFPWPPVAPVAGDRFSELTFQGQTYRVLAHPFSSGARQLILYAAAPLEGNRTVLRTFSAGLFWSIPALLAVSALGGYALSRRALQPVDRLTAATRSISVSNLSERLPVPETHDELQRLSETYNAMLARLESAVNELKRFTGDASHELRSPVSFVRTTAELALRNRQIDPASRRAFEEIVAECGKAGDLLRDMLILARADAGNSRLAFEPVDLVEVVKTVCLKARQLTEPRGHTLTAAFADDSFAPVWADYASLQRLLWILIDNAAKYTSPRGVIKVALAVDEETATVTVEDSGTGISQADLPHIFERFYRADPSRSQVEGSGLGLSIAAWIANVHQATLSAESRENVGSIFKIVFPLFAGDVDRQKDSPAAKSLTRVS
jgi:heavy metal sensor kinase